ncbi:MAG: PAS domain-containing protein [Woeseia sp.]|nr:PAS domain-containing protein [Woeseia sp.]MBT6209225.1 PAS domain-containing protein [Woeseia sp.]
MEHSRRTKRVTERAAVSAGRTSSPGLLRRRSEPGLRVELPDSGSSSRRPQHSSRSSGRERPTDGAQSTESLLRSTELDRKLDKKKQRTTGDGGPPRAKHILDSLNTGVVIIDNNLLIEMLNPAAENILCISESRALNQSLLQLLGDDQELQDILQRVQATGDNYANELRLSPNEVHAAERLVECRVSRLTDEQNRDGLLIEMSDVTRRSKISRENALLIQHGAGRQMVRQLAHEIKNPLGGLRGAAQLLERQLESKELTEYTDVIISEADRLAALVDTLLGPGGPPNKQEVNIHELLEYVMRLVTPELGENIRITRDYDPGLPSIALDRDQMVQAFLNLVRNAAAALGEQGQITLRSRAVMNYTIGDTRHPVIASIEIEDDGPGISPELQDSIFYPLVTSRPDGTGLGLPAAQELISRHGGLIEFDSRPGKTVFQIRVPLTDAGHPHG